MSKQIMYDRLREHAMLEDGERGSSHGMVATPTGGGEGAAAEEVGEGQGRHGGGAAAAADSEGGGPNGPCGPGEVPRGGLQRA